MASLKRWLAVGLTACFVLALAYLPPRGAESSGKSPFVGQPLWGTPARQHAQALADEWRKVDAAVRLLEDRQRVTRDSLRASPTIVFRGATLPPKDVHNVETVMDSVWRDLGLGETKVRVTLVIELQRPYSSDTPTPLQDRVAYLAPDSTHRTTCLAYLPAGPYWTLFILGKRHEGFGRFAQWLEAGLGPCAFYAAYGTPGRSVESWLVARHWDVGLYVGSHGIAGERFSSLDLLGNPSSSWYYWDGVYSFPPATVACLAGRPSGCRAAVLAGAAEERTIPIPNVVLVERRWWRVQNLLPGERYLGDVARAVGRERFLNFWTTALSVDTALAGTLKRPVGEWTAEWQRGFVHPIRLGPTPPLGGVALALAIAVLAVVLVSVTASRRQVR